MKTKLKGEQRKELRAKKESIIEKEICKYAEGFGWKQFKFRSPNNNGVPDRLFLRDKVCMFIEFKSTGEKMTRLQKILCKEISAENFDVYCVDNIPDGIKIIDSYNKKD